MGEETVRRTSLADVPAIQDLAREAWHAAYDDILGENAVSEMLDTWYDRDGLESSVTDDGAVFLVADGDRSADDQTGDTLRGFAHASADESGTWHLARIYVDPSLWGEGVGTALLEAVEAALRERGVERYELAVLAENDVAVNFYESRGFERTRTDAVELAGVETTEYWYAKSL